MNKKILIDLIGMELIALVVVVGYKLSPMLLPKADLTVQPDPACNLQQQACAVTLPNGGTNGGPFCAASVMQPASAPRIVYQPSAPRWLE